MNQLSLGIQSVLFVMNKTTATQQELCLNINQAVLFPSQSDNISKLKLRQTLSLGPINTTHNPGMYNIKMSPHQTCSHKISKQREFMVLNRKGTQQKPKLSMVTPPGMRVNIGNINFPKVHPLDIILDGRVCIFGGMYVP